MAKHKAAYDIYNTLKHPEKLKGPKRVMIRSSWERKFAEICDLNPMILEWASEPFEIPYRDPVTGSQKIYIPDFLVAARKASGQIVRMLIEVKPKHEAVMEEIKNARDAEQYLRNLGKWKAAMWFCQRRGLSFKFITEDEMFGSAIKAPKKVKASTKAIKRKIAASKKPMRRTISKPKKNTLLKRKKFGRRWRKR